MYRFRRFIDMSFVLKEDGGLVSDEGLGYVVVEVFDGFFSVHPVIPHEDLDYLLVRVDGYGMVELSAYSHEGGF